MQNLELLDNALGKSSSLFEIRVLRVPSKCTYIIQSIGNLSNMLQHGIHP